MKLIGEYLVSRSSAFQVSLAVGLVILIGIVDHRTEPELSLALLYLVPIFQATWFAGRTAGSFISFLSVVSWILARTLAASGHEGTVTFYWNVLTQFGIFIIVTYVVSMQLTLKRSLEKERTLARTDFLTGVMNRRAFSELLAAETGRSARYEHPVSLAYVDLDNFKDVNDQQGHAMGDTVLRTIVMTMQKNVRSTDTVARLGGDEFVILFPETGEEAAEHIVRDIHGKVNAVMRENKWPVTASIGLITCTHAPGQFIDMIQMAEKLMYAAKGAGKNTIKSAVFSGGVPASGRRELVASAGK